MENWQYTRDLNFQLLEYLSAKSDIVRNQSQAPSSTVRIVPVDLSLFKQTARIADSSKSTYSVIDTSAGQYNSAELNSDVLGIDGSGIIPTFGSAAFDQMIVKNTHEPLMFEYWIEDMMF